MGASECGVGLDVVVGNIGVSSSDGGGSGKV